MKNRVAKKIISFALILMTLIALVFSLSACTAGKEEISARKSGESVEDFVARVLTTDINYQIRFVAASNGYDITNKDFVDSNEDLGANLEYAKDVLNDVFDNVTFEEKTDRDDFEKFVDTLTEESIDAVIASEKFKTEYDLETSTSFPSILLVWIGKFLGLITSIVGDYYVLAILIFAIIVEVVMLPMAVKQQKNSIGMAKLRPAMARIEKKYAGRTDQVTMRKKQQEIMELQQKSGYSPFAGCLPLIIQLIIVGFILYPIIQNPLRYVLNESTDFSNALLTYATAPQAAGGLGLDISAGNVMELLSSLNANNITGVMDFELFANGEEILKEYASLSIPHFSAFGINLGRMPAFTNILILVPLFNVVGQWFTMRLTRKWTGMGYNMAGADGQDKASVKMMDIIPLLITVFILFKVPAMIGIYWFFRSLVSLGKQFIMQKVMPVPKYTAEEIKEMEKAAKERQKAQKEALKQQPKVRSLHYIDADDYDELPEAKNSPQVSDTNKKFGGGSAPEIKD